MGFFDGLGKGILDVAKMPLSLIGQGPDPMEEADKFYKRVPGKVTPYYDPYINAGKSSLEDIQGQYKDLMNDPGSILSRLGKGYQSSPGYDFRKNQGLQAINNAAASGGMQGTMNHQQQAGDLAGNLASEDYNGYLQNALNLWGKGLQGKEGLSSQGFNASSQLADLLGGNMMSRGNLAYTGAANKNKSNTDTLGGIGGLASKFIFG